MGEAPRERSDDGTHRVRPAGGKPHVAVVGAGAFGGWTALHLLHRGAQVTLLDAAEPPSPLAASAGETRVIRHIYPGGRLYVDLAGRSLHLWKKYCRQWRRPLYRQTGLLWMVSRDDGSLEREALENLRAADVKHQVLGAEEVRRRFPLVDPGGIRWAIYEEEAGYLLARAACAAVVEHFVREGGAYRRERAAPGAVARGELRELRLGDGSLLRADLYLFACGAWLGKLFPDLLGSLLRVSRQEVFTFRLPEASRPLGEPRFPVWADHGTRFWYGIPAAATRSFKVADDTLGPAFDPTAGRREPSADGLRRTRDYLRLRFPALQDAPLMDSRVCQYASTPDSHFILDRHPQAGNLWLLGGGSGHGFKHGPALGEQAAACLLGERAPERCFTLARRPGQVRGAGGAGTG
ncbi:MAG: NAD(P)/FAD-dependent oxidoreductase [Acidobacteriota bacterium]